MHGAGQGRQRKGRRRPNRHGRQGEVKRWVNAQGVKAVELWLGISVDEKGRVQAEKSGKWANRYPLIEARMNRGAAGDTFKRHRTPGRTVVQP